MVAHNGITNISMECMKHTIFNSYGIYTRVIFQKQTAPMAIPGGHVEIAFFPPVIAGKKTQKPWWNTYEKIMNIWRFLWRNPKPPWSQDDWVDPHDFRKPPYNMWAIWKHYWSTATAAFLYRIIPGKHGIPSMCLFFSMGAISQPFPHIYI